MSIWRSRQRENVQNGSLLTITSITNTAKTKSVNGRQPSEYQIPAISATYRTPLSPLSSLRFTSPRFLLSKETLSLHSIVSCHSFFDRHSPVVPWYLRAHTQRFWFGDPPGCYKSSMTCVHPPKAPGLPLPKLYIQSYHSVARTPELSYSYLVAYPIITFSEVLTRFFLTGAPALLASFTTNKPDSPPLARNV